MTESMAEVLAGKRLVLVTGKGGVGKSTCAAALAVAAARSGKRVLLVELGARPVAGDLLEGVPPDHDPAIIAAARFPSLWACRLDERRALQEYLIETLKLKGLVKLATENRVLARLWQAAPSVDEMSILNALWRFESERDAAGRPRFDLIVVDMPSTGHALSMLGVPRGALAMIRGSTLATRAREIDAMLHDTSRTAICIVTLPEELPVNEAVQLADRLQRDLELSSTHVLINGVAPDVFDAGERATIERLAQEDSAARRLFVAARRRVSMVSQQARRIRELKERLEARFHHIAWTRARGVGLVDSIADALSRA